MTAGKPGIAPCGCVGVHITANYVQCPTHDTVNNDKDSRTLSGVKFSCVLAGAVHRPAACPKCASADIEPFAYTSPTGRVYTVHCVGCGSVW